MRLIDADALHAVFVKMAEFKPNPPDEPCGAYRRLVFHISEGIRAINDAPTIDAVPVVRCKDCFLYGECKAAKWYGENGNGYCSVGDRSKDNE